MVRVAVSTFWTERDDHVGPNAPDLPDERRHSDCWIDLVNPAVRVAQEFDSLDTEHRGGRLRPAQPLWLVSQRGLVLHG